MSTPVGQLVFVAVYPLWSVLVLALCAGVVVLSVTGDARAARHGLRWGRPQHSAKGHGSW